MICRLKGIHRIPYNRRRVILELRKAAESDEPFLWEMLYLAAFVPPGAPPIPRSILGEPAIARYVEGWGTRAGDSGLIALGNGEPVGAAWLRFFPASSPGYGFVDEKTPELSVALLPDYRGRGIGSRLVKQLIGNVSALSLSCDPENPARRLYLRLGFEPQQNRRTMLKRKL